VKAGKFPLAYPTAGFGALCLCLARCGTRRRAKTAQQFTCSCSCCFGFPGLDSDTLTNLAGVTLRVESAKPTFAGDEVFLPVEIMNTSRATRYGIEVVLPDADKTRERVDCIPRESAARLTLRFAAHHRGEHKIEN
jgi:hypothetical protein